MRMVTLTQGTPEWLAWRRGGIGGSDATVIMRQQIDPARPVSLDDLLAEKLRGVEREQTFAMRRGIRSESPARALLEAREGVLVRPACVEHDEQPWLRASLDGLDFWGELVAEIKAPRVLDHECALAGLVPHHYVPQCQHQLLVTGCTRLWYVSYSVAVRFGGPEAPSLAVVEVQPDAEYAAQMLEAEEAFWARVLAARAGKVS